MANDTATQNVKFECLKLAIEAPYDDKVELAQKFYEFVTGTGPAKEEQTWK